MRVTSSDKSLKGKGADARQIIVQRGDRVRDPARDVVAVDVLRSGVEQGLQRSRLDVDGCGGRDERMGLHVNSALIVEDSRRFDAPTPPTELVVSGAERISLDGLGGLRRATA